MATSLYICYFGVREPLVQTQVIPYLVEIGKSDIRMHLLTFEPEVIDRADADRLQTELRTRGIEWSWLRYHKRPSALATAYDIFRGTVFSWNYIRRERPAVLHCRVHVPGVMAAIARKLSRHKPKILFDIRGFFPEEFVDAGIWPAGGWLYRSAKRAERWMMKESDGFVVLTEKAREILFPNAIPQPDGGWLTPSVDDETRPKPKSKIQNPKSVRRPIEVIPCCIDLDRFSGVDDAARTSKRLELGVAERPVIAYVGSFGGWYLSDEMMDFFDAARQSDPATFVLILTQRDVDKVVEMMRGRDFSDDDFLVTSLPPNEIADYLVAADIAISFIKPCFSKLSSSPTKNAEYLACGVPIIANRGVGDVDEFIGRNRVGALVADFSRASYVNAISEIRGMEDASGRCRKAAEREFDLDAVGGKRYRRLYSRLLGYKTEEG